MAQILTVEQAAAKLQMSPKIVREYLRLGMIPGRKIGRAWRVVETDLERWVSTGQSEPQPRVSALGFLKQFPGQISTEAWMAEKHTETEEEERRLEERARSHRARKPTAHEPRPASGY
jgi:excisionase family DNA binding protein